MVRVITVLAKNLFLTWIPFYCGNRSLIVVYFQVKDHPR
jgi:hypothetical protein